MSIRTRLTLWYSLLLGTVIVVFGISSFTLLNWAWRTQIQDNMRLAAEGIVETISSSFDTITGEINRPPLQRRLSQMIYTAPGMYVQIWGRDGGMIEQTANTTFIYPFDRQGLMNVQLTTIDVILDDGTPAIVSTFPLVRPDGGHIGAIQIMSPLTLLKAAMSRLVWVMVGAGGVALVVSFLIGLIIAGQALQPIETISQIATQITAADDLSKRIPYEGANDELGQLAATFNTTLARLERLFKAQRRFVADISHELRTPLTTIQGNVDLIRRFYPQMDSLEVEAIESENKRMVRLVGDLLLLAQADAGRLPLDMRIIDMDTLALELYRQAKVLAGKKVEVVSAGIEAVRIKGDTDRLKQLMLNLITNAIKYTPEGGRVTLQLRYDEGFAKFSVRDTGIGIPEKDLPHIFERFYRVDKARARDMGGAGLGLSISLWIAEAHGGRIFVERVPEQGSTFTVQLPALGDVQPESTRETQRRLPILRRGATIKPG